MTQSAAQLALAGVGLAVGAVTGQASGTVPPGSVISQSPLPGAAVASGHAVDLVMSSGPAPDYPNSMAVLGDSLSRAVFADDMVWGLEDGQPEHSWSTGDDSRDSVLSHYERILSANPGIRGHNDNLAVSGAEMDDLPGQANNAINAGPEYVTICLGGNDVCSGSTAGITSGDSYQADFETGVDILQAGLPDAMILVCPAPDVCRIWEVGHNDFGCQLKWTLFGFCDSVLRSDATGRATARAAIIDYNSRLSTVCSAQGLIYDSSFASVQFAKGDLSNVDCFHPAESMQQMLAAGTYDASHF